jgi:hypothetical protein
MASQSMGGATQVQNHVHGAVIGPGPRDILLGTHFGLRLSHDAGATWVDVAGTGGGMVAAIVKVPTTYSAAVMPAAMNGMSGASMSMSSPAHMMYSINGLQWTMARGLPAASISNLASAPTGTVDWASVTGRGIYRSSDGGRTWTLVVPTTTLITALLDTGPSLVVGTPDGLGVTPSATPALPATLTLKGAINTVSRWWSCPTCLVATLGGGGVALSRDNGGTWQQVPARETFDSVASFASSGPVLFGMVASPIDPGKGVWRSTDSGKTWTEVLKQPQVDFMFDVPDTTTGGASLLAFQWGITEWRSTDGGATWRRFATL